MCSYKLQKKDGVKLYSFKATMSFNNGDKGMIFQCRKFIRQLKLEVVVKFWVECVADFSL